MDILAHALLTLILFSGTEGVWWAVFLSVIVDAVVFVPIMISRLARGERGPPKRLTLFEKQISFLYNLTHSIPIFLAVFFTVWAIAGRPWAPLLAWPLHIVVDIPTHSRKFFPTPFLWPISGWTFDGWSWGTKRMMLIIYTTLAALAVLRFVIL